MQIKIVGKKRTRREVNYVTGIVSQVNCKPKKNFTNINFRRKIFSSKKKITSPRKSLFVCRIFNEKVFRKYFTAVTQVVKVKNK